MQKKNYVQEILDIIHSGLPQAELAEKLSDYHENDLADALTALTPEERQKVYTALGVDTVAEIFSYLDDAEPYLKELSRDEAAKVISNMDSDDAADALEGAAASGNATAQKVLDNSRVQQALSFARRADAAQAQLERLSDLDGYDLSNLTFFPTAGDAALTRQNLAMLENLRDHQQEVEVPSITGDNGTNSGSGQPGGTGGYQRSYTSSSGNTYVYAPNFIIYGSMDPEDLRSLMDDGYERFCEYVERYEREKRRTQYGT